jgi:hypothetical protein
MNKLFMVNDQLKLNAVIKNINNDVNGNPRYMVELYGSDGRCVNKLYDFELKIQGAKENKNNEYIIKTYSINNFISNLIDQIEYSRFCDENRIK